MLERLLTVVFLSSLETEELEHHAIRVAFVGRAQASDAAGPGAPPRWRALTFRSATRFEGRHLLRLARATGSDSVFTMVALGSGGLEIVGLAREVRVPEAARVLTLVARAPGVLEAWAGGSRLLEYARGVVQLPPENVLLDAGPVRRALDAFARAVGAGQDYLTAIASILRHVVRHTYGGILVVSGEEDLCLRDEAGYVTADDVPLCALLREHRDACAARADGTEASLLARDALRAEIDRAVAEIGRMTALDGATILDRALGLRGFGLVLPISTRVVVLEALDAEAHRRVGFPLERRGARHHAAASYAAAHPGSVVFVASTDGEVACMLRESSGPSDVLLWRYRPGDLA